MNDVSWLLLALAILGLLVYAGYRINKHWRATVSGAKAPQAPNDFKISYVPSDMEWSGSTSGTLPLKTLTYKQYECLEDAKYGFKIVGVLPTAMQQPQPHKTRAHGMKTVTSLAKHGFLSDAGDGSYVINDYGLNALAVCTVRY